VTSDKTTLKQKVEGLKEKPQKARRAEEPEEPQKSRNPDFPEKSRKMEEPVEPHEPAGGTNPPADTPGEAKMERPGKGKTTLDTSGLGLPGKLISPGNPQVPDQPTAETLKSKLQQKTGTQTPPVDPAGNTAPEGVKPPADTSPALKKVLENRTESGGK
jgi:hypothetical protein